MKFYLHLGKLFLQFISKLIILSLGWGLLIPDDFRRLNEHQYVVAVFSHTSYADFCILVLYLLAYGDDLKYVRTLVKPQPFAYIGWFLRSLGAIPATKIEEKNGGAIENIIEELKKQEKFVFLISPKGTIVKRDWRSGYYAIAKHFNAHFMVVGLDYEKKYPIISKSLKFSANEGVVKSFLYEELGKIVPLFPEEEMVEIRKHKAENRGIVDWQVFVSSILVVILMLLIIMMMLQ